MKYREYGKTGKMVSILGFGTSRFLREDYATDSGKEKLISLLIEARENGVNFFDTGDAYGDGRCEKLLGDALKRMSGNAFVSTKSSHLIVGDASLLRKRLEASLKRLGVDKINFYHFWRILNMEQFHFYTRKGGPYEGALEAQKEGLIDHICFSAHCDGEEIAQIAASGCFEGVILSYNIINFKYREHGLKIAKKHDLGVAVMNPLGGGSIPRNARAFSFAVQEGESISAAAMNFCASDENVTLVLSGITNRRELHENLASMEKLGNFTEERKEKIKGRIAEQFNFLCNGCRYCTGCPHGIEVYKLMLAYNFYLLNDRDPRAFFAEIVNWGDWPRKPYPCAQCGLCEKKCSQHISISKHIIEINEIIEWREKYLLEGLNRCFGGDENKRIGIYGAGEYAREMLQEYCQEYGGLDREFFIFDSNPKKYGTEFKPYAFPIRPPEDIAESGVERIIIASEDHYNEIYENIRIYEKRGIEITGFTIGKQYARINDE